MIVSFGTVDIKMAEFNSYEELEEALAQCENGSIFRHRAAYFFSGRAARADPG